LWHLEEAERCLRVNNPGAAAFHLRWLGKERLPGPLQERKDNLTRHFALTAAKKDSP
jgi:hypothetical protein